MSVTEHLSQSEQAAGEDSERDEQLIGGAEHASQVVRRDLSQVERC